MMKIDLNEKNIGELKDVYIFSDLEYVAIDTSSFSKKNNVLKLSRQYSTLKDFIIKLANNGLYLVNYKDGVSIFEKFITAKDFLTHMNNKEDSYKVSNNLIYDLHEPEIQFKENNLLVIFSSFQIHPYLVTSPDERYFLKDFPNIYKYIPKNTYILRIADIGGVAGNFYLNTYYNNLIEMSVYKLIEERRKSLNIKKKHTLLFGFSKGGTASFFYSIKHRYKAIAVDPIITDKFHIDTYNDSHFTQGIFPYTKDIKFKQLFEDYTIHKNIYIITSKKSQQFTYIHSFMEDNDRNNYINLIISKNPSIKDHPSVGENTINIFIMLINTIFYGINKQASLEVQC